MKFSFWAMLFAALSVMGCSERKSESSVGVPIYSEFILEFRQAGDLRTSFGFNAYNNKLNLPMGATFVDDSGLSRNVSLTFQGSADDYDRYILQVLVKDQGNVVRENSSKLEFRGESIVIDDDSVITVLMRQRE